VEKAFEQLTDQHPVQKGKRDKDWNLGFSEA
jgi:hypothetical protein